MSITIKKVICFLIFLFFIPIAQAGVHVEPYVSAGGSLSNSISSKSSIFMAYNLGGRLGYSFLGFSTGLDLSWTYYDVGNNSSDPNSTILNSDPVLEEGIKIKPYEVIEDFQPFSIGVFGSVELPFLFNAYGTLFYTFGDRDLLSHQGYGVKAGVSYLSTFFVQLNLELKWANYICMAEAKCKKATLIYFLV